MHNGNEDFLTVLFDFMQNLSQFWYDEVTSDILAKEALEVAGESGRYVYKILFSQESVLMACPKCPHLASHPVI